MSAQQPSGSALTREAILRALSSLSEELGKQNVTGELCLFGGTVMVLAFTARLSTKDVDASARIPVKTQYLVEGLFEESKI
jgi:hypothetical protein